MVIRILITIIFIIIAFFKCKKNLIIEKETNPKLKKDGKLNFLTSAIPFTLFLVFIVYVIVLFTSILFLQSKCNEMVLIETHDVTNINDKYQANELKNQTYKFENNNEVITIKNIDKLLIEVSPSNKFIEVYEIKSNNKIINFLLYGSFERGLIIYDTE